jgi:hypothetical protein
MSRDNSVSWKVAIAHAKFGASMRFESVELTKGVIVKE